MENGLYTAGGGNQREPILPVVQGESPRACSIRGVNYAIRRRLRRIIYKLAQKTLFGEFITPSIDRRYFSTVTEFFLICTWHLTMCYGLLLMQLVNCVNKRHVIRRWIGMTSTSLATFVPRVYSISE